MSVMLGGVELQGFEVPSGLRFGGRQNMVVHRLPGGGRIVDVLGPDAADISWSGILAGGDANGRVVTLDTLRCAGAVIPLEWHGFQFPVLIAELNFTFRNAWWIPYYIRCVVANPAGNTAMWPLPAANYAISADVTEASSFTDMSGVVAALAPPDSGVQGTLDNATALAAIGQVTAATDVGIAAAGSALATDDLAAIASAAGTLANLSAARGFIARASSNLNSER
jgi:hypothetical protein